MGLDASILTGASVNTADGGGDEGGGAAGTSWFDLEARVHASRISALTESIPVVLNVANVGEALGAHAIGSGLEGGALQGSGGVWNLLAPGGVYTNLSGSRFAVSFQAAMATIGTGRSSYVGIKDPGSGAQLAIGTDTTVSTTDFIAFGYDGIALTTVRHLGTADVTFYTWRLISDGTTLTLERAAPAGGQGALSSATLLTSATHFPTTPGAPGFVGTLAVGQGVAKCLFSFVGPV